MILSKQEIDVLFEKHTHQAEIILDLYRKVIPDWDRVEKVEKYPRCGHELNRYLFEKFMEFDKVHHPGCMHGGAWMNWGFSVDHNLSSWEVKTD